MGEAVVGAPLPTSSLEQVVWDVPFSREYSPAPLDEISLFNGVLAFDHPEVQLPDEEYEWLLGALEEEFGWCLSTHSFLPDDQVADLVVPDTAPGIPYSTLYGPTKGDVLKHETVGQLWHEFMAYDQVIGCTLKDELRLSGKDARLFRPANIAGIVAGIKLFHEQNEELNRSRFLTPYKIGIGAPGRELGDLWHEVLHFSPLWGAADGSKHDANFPAWGWRLIRDWRKLHLAPETHACVDRYYAQMYQGWTRLGGALWQLKGNPSGQFNTASDNTLVMIAGLLLAAKRLGVRREMLYLAVYGDDIIYSTKDRKYSQPLVLKIFREIGMFLEMPDGEFSPFDGLTFIGTHPTTHDGHQYVYDYDKLTSSFHYRERGPVKNYAEKVAAIVLLLAYHPNVDFLRHWAKEFVRRVCPEHFGVLRIITKPFAERLYQGYESAPVGGSFPPFFSAAKTGHVLKTGHRLERVGMEAISLRSIVDGKAGGVFGNTPTGKEWCIKALHPAETAISGVGVPCFSEAPSATLSYQSTFTISAPPWAGENQNWGFELQILPHPVCFLSGRWTSPSPAQQDSTTVTGKNKKIRDLADVGLFEVLNSQLQGDTHAEKYASLCSFAERFRITHMSVTLQFTGSSTASQGSIACCQRQLNPRTANASMTGNSDGSLFLKTGPNVYFYSGCNTDTVVADKPSFDKCSTLKNSYVGDAKEGIYVPLRLGHSFTKWTNTGDSIAWIPRPDTREMMFPVVGGKSGVPLHNEAPFPSLSAGWADPTNERGWTGSLTCPFLNEGVADVCAVGVGYMSSFRGVVRFGLEVQCSPGSLYAPQLRAPAQHDELALETYYRIVRELKDAYPASYNDWGKLWDVIKKAASVALPFISPVISKFAGLFTARRDKKLESETQLEKRQDETKKQMQQAPVAPRQRPRKPKPLKKEIGTEATKN